LAGFAPPSGGGGPDAMMVYYTWGLTGKKPPETLESMAGGAACIRYTGLDPWNKNLNLDNKLYYCCNYHKLTDISC